MSAYVLEACLLFYQETKDEKHLEEARRIGNSALIQFVQPDGSLKEAGQWGGSDLCDALLDLYEVDKDGRWLTAVQGMLRFLHEKCRDKNGRYGEYWNEDRSEQSLAKFHLLHMAPAARAFWHAAAVKPPSPPTR